MYACFKQISQQTTFFENKFHEVLHLLGKMFSFAFKITEKRNSVTCIHD